MLVALNVAQRLARSPTAFSDAGLDGWAVFGGQSSDVSNSGVTRIKQGTWSGFLPPRAVVMIPRRLESPQIEKELSPVRAIFCFDDADQAPVRSLVERMVEAMGLDLNLALLTSPKDWGAAVEEYRAELVVFLGQPAATAVGGSGEGLVLGQWSVITLGSGQELPVLLTHDAKEVLVQPALKRPVWEHLKQVSQKLGVVPKSGR